MTCGPIKSISEKFVIYLNKKKLFSNDHEWLSLRKRFACLSLYVCESFYSNFTTENKGSNSGRKTLRVMYNKAFLSTLTTPVIIGLTLLIAVFVYAIVNCKTIEFSFIQLLIFIITLYKCYRNLLI